MCSSQSTRTQCTTSTDQEKWRGNNLERVESRKSLCIFTFLILIFSLKAQANEFKAPELWHLEKLSQPSLHMEPVRENAKSRDGLKLALKHFTRVGAQPVLLIHGLAQNDRGWDAIVKQYSFARFLHAQGFDVWVGNLRSAGTPGFKSETPDGPHHWTVDDYAINDIPGLIEAVTEKTEQLPFVIGHSMAAWALEGYLAGLVYDRNGRIRRQQPLGLARQSKIKGMITLAGVYNLKWDKTITQAAKDPILSELDFYRSNYELELLASIKMLYLIVPHLYALPLDWVSRVLYLPLEQIPWIGKRLSRLYQNLQEQVIQTPLLSTLYYPPNSDPEMVRLHVRDGLEDLGPRLVEQLANALNNQKTESYYHIDRPADAYVYGSVRSRVEVPMLFVGGGRDRLASSREVYEDGYLATQTKDKQFLHVEHYGHLDIMAGINSPKEVMAPVAKWMHERK